MVKKKIVIVAGQYKITKKLSFKWKSMTFHRLTVWKWRLVPLSYARSFFLWGCEWASACMNGDIFTQHTLSQECFHFQTCQKCSVIAATLWNNNIQFHSAISHQRWQVWTENGYFTPGGNCGICFVNDTCLIQGKKLWSLSCLTKIHFITASVEFKPLPEVRGLGDS